MKKRMRMMTMMTMMVTLTIVAQDNSVVYIVDLMTLH